MATVTPTKKLRFRGDTTSTDGTQYRVEDISDLRKSNNKIQRDIGSSSATSILNIGTSSSTSNLVGRANSSAPVGSNTTLISTVQNLETETSNIHSFLDFFRIEMTRGYILDHDEERYTARRQRIYSFIRIPADVERFMIYGLMQCADSFLYIHTFLPIRFILAIWAFITRAFFRIFRFRRNNPKLLTPAEICDLLKGSIWIVVLIGMIIAVDTNRVYHIIKSQSIIKLYIFYNMLEVGDRLLSAFGQDCIDALFWTAAEQKTSKLRHFGLFTHIIFALVYVILHSVLIMFQAVTLNVAVNASNKGLLTIMISNNFIELKGSVFKKFDKNNLFQLSCSDVRERFHLTVLLFIVLIQTMKEFDWSVTQFVNMLPDCFAVLLTEIVIDWIKHAFITRFNELPDSIYREYTTSLAYDMTQTRQKHAFSDHSDLVARRMGFIPFPLSIILLKAIYSAISFENTAAWILFGLAFLFVLCLRICLTICALGKACKLMKEHQEERSNSTPSSMTNVTPIAFVAPSSSSTSTVQIINGNANLNNNNNNCNVVVPPHSNATTNPTCAKLNDSNQSNYSNSNFIRTSTVTSTPVKSQPLTNDIELDVTNSLELGATALFSNSDVDLDDVCLNENILEPNNTNGIAHQEEEMAHSEPELQLLGSESSASTEDSHANTGGGLNAAQKKERCKSLPKRTHKRSESEPSMQSIVGDLGKESQA